MRGMVVLVLVFVLGSCTDRSFTPVTPSALDVGTPFTVFTATNRAQDPNGSYGYERSDHLDLLELTVSIPPTHTPGRLDFAYADPDPVKEFTLAGQRELADTDAFLARVQQHIRERGEPSEVVLFVHGYNATQAETAFRAAQLAHDIDLPGALMIYSWPSRGKPLGYAYDAESMMFARDGLETVLRRIRGSGIRNIVLVAHSMGSVLTMETLRQIEIDDPGWTKRSLQGIVLISPDLDIDLFHAQMRRIEQVPDNFLVLVSGKDPALGLSAFLRGDRGRDRLGNLTDTEVVSDLPITVIDTTAFSKSAESQHFVAATSPALIAIFSKARQMVDTFGTEQTIRDQLGLPANVVRNDAVTGITLIPEPPS